MKLNPNYIYSPAMVARTKKMELFMVKLHLLGQDPIKSHSRCGVPHQLGEADIFILYIA